MVSVLRVMTSLMGVMMSPAGVAFSDSTPLRIVI